MKLCKTCGQDTDLEADLHYCLGLGSSKRHGFVLYLGGTDLAGKSGLVKKVESWWKITTGDEAVVMKFPNYETASGQLIREILTGKIPGIDQLPIEFRAQLFALNRREMRDEIEFHLQAGDFIILDRYAPCNRAYMLAELAENNPTLTLRDLTQYSEWLVNLDATFNNIKPDYYWFLTTNETVWQHRLNNLPHRLIDKNDVNWRLQTRVAGVYQDIMRELPSNRFSHSYQFDPNTPQSEWFEYLMSHTWQPDKPFTRFLNKYLEAKKSRPV